MVIQGVGVIKSARQHRAVHVPLAGMIRAIAERAQALRQQQRPGGPPSGTAAAQARQRVPAHLLGVIPGENARPGWPAPGGVVELGEPQAAVGQPVQVGRRDLPSIAACVREAHVVGDDEDNVRLGRHGRCRAIGGRQAKEQQTN